MSRIIAIVLCLALLGACSKNGKNEDDNQLPVIQISAPANNQSFTAGQTIAISGIVTDNSSVAELHVHISNNTTGQLLIDIHRYPSTSNYTLNESFPVQAGITYKIQVIATDKSGNQGNSSVIVSSI
jgi:hypothetical protein